jgi:hypothetical protein
MTDTNKDKIRVERYEEFENQYTLASNKLELVELKDFIDTEVHRVIQEVLYQTGEDYIYFESGNLNISAIKLISGCYQFKTTFNVYYSELESNKEYEQRLNQLKIEESQLKDLANKFGYKLEKVSE